MERATIITLGNSTPMAASSFEQAFGEYSELFGKKARARRQTRRMERINNRKERRSARQAMRLDKKRNRVAARAERRQMRSTARQQRRDEKSEGKRRRERADLEQEREFAPDETQEGSYEQDPGYAPQDQGGGYAEDQGGYAPQDQGGYAEDQGGYAEDQGGYDEGGYSDEGGYDEGGYDEESEGFDDLEDEEGFDDLEDADGFDGVMGADNEMIDVPYSPQVNQNVADAAKRIEWNLELASRLNEKAKSNPSAKINDAISQCRNRVAELESSMAGYCNFEGDFTSDADGKMMFRKRRGGMKLKNIERRKRRQEMMAAKMQARKERNAVRMKSGLTPVQSKLNPNISENRIEIPAKELGSNATGIIGLDGAMDYDATATEIKLGVDGAKTSKIPFKAIAIGVVIGGVAMMLLRKYKVI